MTAHVSRTAYVAASRRAVWLTLADFGALSTWADGVDHSALLTSEPVGMSAVRRVQVGRNALRETVVIWEPHVRLSYAITGLPPVVRSAINTWTLADEGVGTRVTLSSAVLVLRPPVVGRLVARRLGSASDGLLAGLTRYHSLQEDRS